MVGLSDDGTGGKVGIWKVKYIAYALSHVYFYNLSTKKIIYAYGIFFKLAIIII